MRKEVIMVPKDECALDTLAILDKHTAKAWIFFHKNVIEKLKKSVDDIQEEGKVLKLYWKATEKYPDTILHVKIGEVWSEVIYVVADDIAFRTKVLDPEHIYFLKMQE